MTYTVQSEEGIYFDEAMEVSESNGDRPVNNVLRLPEQQAEQLYKLGKDEKPEEGY